MSFILHIETATTVCSVSLSKDGEHCNTIQTSEPFRHAEKLHSFIAQLMEQSGVKPGDLAAIAVSKGPGSYTGLRIGVSAAKGMAYALGIPLISIDTLQGLTAGAIAMGHYGKYYCPMLDARRMEVYCAVYNEALEPVMPVQALILNEESIRGFPTDDRIFFFGDGMPKAKELLASLPNAGFIEDGAPSALDQIDLAWKKFNNKQFEDVAYFEPFYLKEFMIGPK